MTPTPALDRHAEQHLLEALEDSPVVLIHGPRQCGKTTLALSIGVEKGYDYISFDDEEAFLAATQDPTAFINSLPPKVILDEIQRVPSLFRAIKRSVDRNRVSGRFLLTGSSNILLLPQLADSLAGRMEIFPLYPFSQSELMERRSGFLRHLFAADFPTRSLPTAQEDLLQRVLAGGYPALITRPTARRRSNWFSSYIDTLIMRDLKDMSGVQSLREMPRLLQALSEQTAQLFNVSNLASPFKLSRTTIRDYISLLERIFLVEILPPWHSNKLNRLTKTPKVHVCDTGLACFVQGASMDTLANDRQAFGHILETFIYQELRRMASWQETPTRFFHFHTKDGVEVDIVLDRGAQGVAGIEVKAESSVHNSDFKGLRQLRMAAGKRFKAGVVLYDGEMCASFGEGMFAIPIRMLWEL